MKKTLKKEFIHYLSLINIVCFTIAILISCKNTNENKTFQKDDFQSYIEFVEKEHNFEITEDINKIYVLSEKGCANCNRSFARIVENNLNDSNSLFLITISGTIIDITPFEKAYSNIIIDQNIDNNKYPIFDGSKVIYLNNNSIDTIIEINSVDLEAKLKYIISN